MQDFDFKRCTRICHSSEREIGAGEKYVSAIIEQGDEFVRQDFADDQWSDPPEGCIGWWRSQVPVLEKGKIYWAPNRVLLAYFESVTAKPDQKNLTYVMGLLLVRKRILQWKDTIEQENREVMVLRHTSSKASFEVDVMDIPPDQIQAIQNELAEQLFTDVIEDDADEENFDEANS